MVNESHNAGYETDDRFIFKPSNDKTDTIDVVANTNRANMVTQTYQCPVCTLQYPTEAYAQQCEAWCTKYNSCNLDIIQHAIKETER